jgi:hypothetical protein
MRLADHSVTADAAQFLGDLAGGHALFPHRFQLVDAFVSPRQGRLLRNWVEEYEEIYGVAPRILQFSKNMREKCGPANSRLPVPAAPDSRSGNERP